jgi:hypothetical protein
MKEIILIFITLMLTSCLALNDGFPKEINGKLKSINSPGAICHAR